MKINRKEAFVIAHAQERKRTQKLKALSKAAVAFSSSLDLERTISRVVQEACKIVECQNGAVLLLDDKGEFLNVASISSPSFRRRASDLTNLDTQIASDEVGEFLGLKKPTWIEVGKLPEKLHSLLDRLETRPTGVILVPLVIDGSSLGFVLLADLTTQDVPTAFNIDFAGMLGSHAAAAIRNAQSVRAVNLQLFETVARGKREWEQTFDAISDGIFISNSDYLLIRANKAFARTFGKHPRDVIGKKCYEIIAQSDHPCAQCPRTNIRLELHHQPIAVSMEGVIRGMISEVTAYPMLDRESNLSAIVHVVKDVTEQKKMHEMVVRSEKLSAIGEMASGIAHDFNNLLASIIGWSEIMLLGDLPPHLKDCAVAIHQAAVDGTETVKRIQDYTRIRKDTEFASVNINEVVQGAIELGRPRWKDWAEKTGVSIAVSTEFGETALAQGNASDLREVFLNIIFNAIDAMPEGGEIKIRTGLHGETVFAAISDSGVGMPEDVQRRVFDPFFTTKGASGNGLGLSVAYGIISRHGGELTVESTPGKGSTFTAFLPIAAAVKQTSESPASAPSRKARILLIDDDKRVLRATEAMLRAEGHSVTKCLGGKEGISALSEQPYDLVITDLGMPEMNGWEVAAKVKAISPRVPVILLTGWGAEIATERLSELGIDAIIQKPCRLPILRQTIDQVLGPDEEEIDASTDAEGKSKSNGLLRIMVIEDNKWFGEALKERLELDGHFVSLAVSGQEGIRSLERQHFDLVLSDLKLPDLSGLEIAGIVRQLRRQAFIAIMTGDVAALDNSLLKGDGVDAILHKPWKEPELQQVIDRAFERLGDKPSIES